MPACHDHQEISAARGQFDPESATPAVVRDEIERLRDRLTKLKKSIDTKAEKEGKTTQATRERAALVCRAVYDCMARLDEFSDYRGGDKTI